MSEPTGSPSGDGARPAPAELEPERRCPECGAKLTVQILPHGYESKCTPCERRARFAAAEAEAQNGAAGAERAQHH